MTIQWNLLTAAERPVGDLGHKCIVNLVCTGAATLRSSEIKTENVAATVCIVKFPFLVARICQKEREECWAVCLMFHIGGQLS